MTRITPITALLAVALSAAGALAQATAPATGPASYDKPLGIAMEEWPYPYAVQFHPLEVEGEPVRMAYMDVSRKDEFSNGGRTVVLLHGKTFYGSYWKSTIQALVDAGYRVVVPDQIGFGKSSKPDIAYSFDLLAAHTISLLDKLGVEQFAVVGHSMGGMLAVRVARNYPGRITHLVLENPIGLEDYRMKVPARPTRHWYEQELNNTDPAKIRAFLARYFVKWDPAYETFVEVRSRVALSGEYPRFAKSAALTYQMIYQQPVRHEFPLIAQPTLLVIGQEDRTTIGRGLVSEEVIKTMGNYPELGKSAAKDIKNARLVELEQVGHIPHLEAPERFHKELVQFLDGKAQP